MRSLAWVLAGLGAVAAAVYMHERHEQDGQPPPSLTIIGPSPLAAKAAGPRHPIGPFVGDGAFAELLDPRTFERVGDHYEAPLPDGSRATLTLDPRFQEAAETVLRLSRAPRGAIVAIAPDGRILAMAGRRSTDPAGSLDGTPDTTLALDVWAPAASVFKVATATALLRGGVTPSTKVCYHGGLRSVMESNLVDSKLDGPCQDLRYGVSHSQNAIIGKLAYQHLNARSLTKAATDLGFGGDLHNWALAGPIGSVTVPPQPDLEFAQTAAGFSGSYLSAVGGAVMTNTVATRGMSALPQIVASVTDPQGNVSVVQVANPTRTIEKSVANDLASMLVDTCVSGSAARSFRGRPRSVAGKTGTLAQDEPYMEYSWFVGFSPAGPSDKAEVSISVIIGNAPSWWMKAHTAAREVLDRALGTGKS